MNAGAVMLTDCVFWLLIVPFLETKDYDLNFVSNLIHPHQTFQLYAYEIVSRWYHKFYENFRTLWINEKRKIY